MVPYIKKLLCYHRTRAWMGWRQVRSKVHHLSISIDNNSVGFSDIVSQGCLPRHDLPVSHWISESRSDPSEFHPHLGICWSSEPCSRGYCYLRHFPCGVYTRRGIFSKFKIYFTLPPEVFNFFCILPRKK